MSPEPAWTPDTNVRSMEDFLKGVLTEVEEVDARILSREPRFREELAEAEKRFASGDLPPLDAPDFLERRLEKLQRR